MPLGQYPNYGVKFVPKSIKQLRNERKYGTRKKKKQTVNKFTVTIPLRVGLDSNLLLLAIEIWIDRSLTRK